MDERTPDLTQSADAEPPSPEVHRLEERAEAVRDNLGELVDELDQRRRRAQPYVVAAVLAGVALAVMFWWRRREV